MTWDYLSWRASCMQADACRSKHIHFRPLALEDTDEIIAWRNSAFVRQHFIYQQPFTRDGHLRWFAEQLLSGRAVQFLVCANDDGRHLGSVYLRDIDRTHGKAELGIFLGETACGHSINTEAVRLLVRYAFEELHLHRVYLRVFADNARAIAAYQKAGFAVEGRLRDSVGMDGTYRDLLLMSVLASEVGENRAVGDA